MKFTVFLLVSLSILAIACDLSNDEEDTNAVVQERELPAQPPTPEPAPTREAAPESHTDSEATCDSQTGSTGSYSSAEADGDTGGHSSLAGWAYHADGYAHTLAYANADNSNGQECTAVGARRGIQSAMPALCEGT